MKKLKENHRYCSWCPEKTTKAVWRESGMQRTKSACEEHRAELSKYETEKTQREERMTEADYETWYKL